MLSASTNLEKINELYLEQIKSSEQQFMATQKMASNLTSSLDQTSRLHVELASLTENLNALNNVTDDAATACITELMDACDSFIPEPERDIDKPFLMPVEDVFSITGRGTVGTGRVESGIIKVGDEIEMIGMGSDKKTTVTGVEMFRKLLDEGRAGDNAGLLLRGIDKEDLTRGMVLAAPGSITPHTKFKASVYVLKKDEGGRHTPFFNGYRPQFYFRTTDVTGVATLPSGTEMVMPGDNVELEVELITPIAMDKELRFAIREGGHTVGAGVVTEIVE